MWHEKKELKGAYLKTTNKPLLYVLGIKRLPREKPPLTAAAITSKEICIIIEIYVTLSIQYTIRRQKNGT